MIMSIAPKKSFGQNFLQDASVVARIIEGADIQVTDWMVEIGPGTGVLTEALSKKANKVIAVELDRDLIPGLLKKFPLSSNVSIVEGDILKLHLTETLKQYGWDGRPYKIVANIPYYVTAPIIQYILRLQPQPQLVVLMIQKEVAERIVAQPGDMSILAVAVQYYADPEILFGVPKTAFHPVPQVDSAVIRLTPTHTFHPDEDKTFFRLVRAGFSARRKTLANNLSSSLHLPKEEVVQKLQAAGLSENIRAQSLSVEDWKRLQEVFIN
jgi:16S rRNA (adenine1518-N6/adenine1519-N6)-dimethyltransferase